MKVPKVQSVAECPGMGTTLPSASNLPSRGPTMIAPMSPANPPTIWTTPLPAKSRYPESSPNWVENHPPS
eukprot:CAMPEP_0184684674 /NCGR_PEP_ID=MMETSP0312-20130426/16276_1 /TAXON_ID=31354 /ORGANISM="Compsopogon coeruleus, Strain SAG 36.94" /LENGTH=69 /DNA_ID=CAMNT_0027138099 /DNA_START=93 /DNA_END=298 /DNA_ORIENTATION=-